MEKKARPNCIREGCGEAADSPDYFTCSEKCKRALLAAGKCVVCAAIVHESMGVHDTCNKQCAAREIRRLRGFSARLLIERNRFDNELGNLKRDVREADREIKKFEKAKLGALDKLEVSEKKRAKVEQDLASTAANYGASQALINQLRAELERIRGELSKNRYELEIVKNKNSTTDAAVVNDLERKNNRIKALVEEIEQLQEDLRRRTQYAQGYTTMGAGYNAMGVGYNNTLGVGYNNTIAPPGYGQAVLPPPNYPARYASGRNY